MPALMKALQNRKPDRLDSKSCDTNSVTLVLSVYDLSVDTTAIPLQVNF